MACHYLYTLELAGGRWYVGTTTDRAGRLEAHLAGEGCAWTATHAPIKGEFATLERLDLSGFEARLREDMEVKRLMAAKGVDSVRGGSYSSLTLTPAQREVLELELRHANGVCLNCGQADHWTDDCPAAASDAPRGHIGKPATAVREDFCTRCGREGHAEKNCYARTTVDGDALCARCGREGHAEKNCYARTTVDGDAL